MPTDYFRYSALTPRPNLDKYGPALSLALKGMPVRWTADEMYYDFFVEREFAIQPERERSFVAAVESILPREIRDPIPVRQWTAREIDKAKWHHIKYRFDEDFSAGFEYPNRFDYSDGCSVCTRGRRYVGRVLANISPGFDRAIHRLLITWDWIVGTRGIRSFEQSGLMGGEFLPIYNPEREMSVRSCRVIQPKELAPPAHESSPIRSEPACTACGLPEWIRVSDHDFWLAYRAEDMPRNVDVLWTREVFGVKRRATRELLVSSRVRSAFKAARIRGVEYRPVELL